MPYVRIEMPLRNVDLNYSDLIPYIALGKANQLGFHNGAAMFTQAFMSYDKGIPSEVLSLFSAQKTCSFFLEKFRIKYKEDFLYVIRHPELFPEDKIEELDTMRRMLVFDDKSIGPEEKAAIEYFEGILRRDRAGIADKIVRQYLVRNDSRFYFGQKVAKLYRYMCENANIDDGKVREEIENLIDMIWSFGRYAVNNK